MLKEFSSQILMRLACLIVLELISYVNCCGVSFLSIKKLLVTYFWI